MMIKVRHSLAAAILALTATGAAAQVGGSDGEKFLTAVRESDGATVTSMVETPGSRLVNYRGLDGNAAIHLVTRGRQPNWLGFLLAKGADPDVADAKGDTALMLAARSGFTEGVVRLLAAEAEIDKTNRLGETALIGAVQGRQPAIVRVLLEAGADPDKQDFAAGFSARDYAKRDTRSRELLQLIENVKSKKADSTGPTIR